MQVRLLGGLEVVDDQGKGIEVAGTKLRSLLVVLSLSVGRAVPGEQIVDALWGEDPPPGVRNGLQGLVSKLRKALGDPALVISRGAGYALDLPVEAVDVHRFEQLAAAGHDAAAAADHERALDLLHEAETLWRGDALAEFAYEEFARPALTRLSELRFSAVEERMSSELALGRHSGVIPALEALVKEHPLREQLRGQLMVALYRAGRQADALRVFQEGRQILGEELGLDPGPELRRLEAAVLAQDPALDAPTATGSVSISASGSGGAEHKWHLPSPITPLVGRDRELRDLTALFAEHRLITLVGPGGVGKTRLALDVARAESAVLANGAVLVELAPVGDPASVRAAIAGVLEIAEPDRLAELIGGRELLIMLDNCEHVIDTAAVAVEDLLEQCPRLHVLATSREALRINGETVWAVPPLASDDAMQLFVQRAHAAGAQFDVSDELRLVIGDICARLDGLPLAIELAAARTRAFPLQQLAARLDDRFRLLTGGSRTALPRQQALRAVVDWSYDLLFEEQQVVFDRLSVFPGGCRLATIQAVCVDGDIGADALEEIVEALVDKSLLIAQSRGDSVRFVQLQTLAHYGREKLAERGDSERVRNRMAEHCAGLCAGSVDAFAGEGQREWLAMVNEEHDNLRAAVEWAIDTDNAEVALAISGALAWPNWLTGKVPEGKRWLDDAFQAKGEVSPGTRALALFGRGFLSFLAGDPAQTDVDFDEAIRTFRELGDLRPLALALGFYSEVAFALGDVDRSRRIRLEAVAVHEEMPHEVFSLASRAYTRAMIATAEGDPASEELFRDASSQYAASGNLVMHTICLDLLAVVDNRRGDLARAADELVRAIELNEELGLTGYMGVLLARLGIVRTSAGDFDGAAAANARALELGQRLMDPPVLGMALGSSARLSLRLGRLDDAERAATEALDIYRSGAQGPFGGRRNLALDVQAGTAMAYAVLGFVAQHNGDGAQADRLHRLGLAQARLTRNPRAIAVAIEGLAGAAALLGDGRRAAQLLGHATQMRSEANTLAGDFEQLDLDRVQNLTMTLLDHDAFVEAFEQGHRSELSDLVG